MRRILTLCVLGISVFTAFVLAQSTQNSGGPPPTAPARPGTPDIRPAVLTPPYIIQPNDVLEIFVWKEEKLTRKVFVRPDGRISFPLIQDLTAAGLSTGELKQRIEDSLRQYIEVPNVTVILEAIQSYRIYVTGKVAKPGVYPSEKQINILQAIAMAGGFLEFADPSNIVVIRTNGDDSTRFVFNYNDVIKAKNFNANMLLKAGDVIVVP
jgi:polysaccharide export outer membrane protein